MRISLVIAFILVSLSAFAQDPTVWRNYGATNANEGSTTPGMTKWPKYKKSSVRVLMLDTAGIVRDTSIASLTSDALKYADSNLYATQYDLTSGLVGKVDTGTTYILVHTYAQLQAALASTTRVIKIGADSIVFPARLSVPSNKDIQGVGYGTRLYTASDNTDGIFTLDNVTNITIKDMQLIGNYGTVNPVSSSVIAADSQIITSTNISTGTGIRINVGEVISLQNLYVHNFGAYAFYADSVGRHDINRGHGVTIDNCTVDNSYFGVYFGERAEYSTTSNLSARYNICGFFKSGGNISLDNPRIEDNRIGYVSAAGTNSAHGCVNGGSINHNKLRSIYMQDITAGEIISGISVFDGDMVFRRCTAVNINGGCAIAAGINFIDGGLNKIQNNIFFKVYNGGVIGRAGSNVKRSGNSFSDGSTNDTAINDAVNTTLQQIVAAGSTTTLPINYTSAATNNTSTEVARLTRAGVATTGMIQFKHPTVATSGGVLTELHITGNLYGAPAATAVFDLLVTFYPNGSAISNADLSATFSINGTMPAGGTRCRFGITADGQYSFYLGDSTTNWGSSLNIVARYADTWAPNNLLSSWLTGWTMATVTTNVGITSVQEVTPKFILNDGSTNISGSALTAGSVPLTKLASQNNATFVANMSGVAGVPTATPVGNGITASGGTIIIDTTASNIKIATQGNVIRAIQGGTANLNDISATAITATGTLATSKPFTTRTIDATAGNITLTLTPTTAGQLYRFVRLDNTANTVTIQMTSGNINGSATNTSMSTQYSNMQLVWNGTNAFLY